MSNLRANFFHAKKSDWIEISILGDGSTVVRKVRDSDKEQFPLDWEAFKSKSKSPIEVGGTPLEEVNGIGDKLADKLRHNGIRNAEELAVLSDGALPKVVGMSAYTIRKAAQDHINKDEPA